MAIKCPRGLLPQVGLPDEHGNHHTHATRFGREPRFGRKKTSKRTEKGPYMGVAYTCSLAKKRNKSSKKPQDGHSNQFFQVVLLLAKKKKKLSSRTKMTAKTVQNQKQTAGKTRKKCDKGGKCLKGRDIVPFVPAPGNFCG